MSKAGQPLTDEELADWNPHDGGGKDVPSLTSHEQRTELANARRFIAAHGDKLRYCPPWGKWLVWDGRRWQIDDGCLVEGMARTVVEDVWTSIEATMRQVDRSEAVAMVSFAKATASANGIEHFL